MGVKNILLMDNFIQKFQKDASDISDYKHQLIRYTEKCYGGNYNF